MERNLEGRVAIVTGAAEGIGFAVARRLARAGARVTVADIDGEAARRAAERLVGDGDSAIGVEADVSDEGSVRGMVEDVGRRLGDADILVNNAGIAAGSAPVQEFDITVWDRTIAVNLRGVFLCCHFALPAMLERGYGRIVNVASIAGKEGNPQMSAYSASKAGVIGFTKSLAKEVARQGIIVNAVSPAVIQTRINDATPPDVLAYMVERILWGEWASRTRLRR